MLKMFTASRRRPAFSSVFYVLCVLMVALSGCADNTIRLLFRPAPAGTVTDPYAPSLAVLRFEDKRPEVWIGQRMGENGGYFQAGSSVPEWVIRPSRPNMEKKSNDLPSTSSPSTIPMKISGSINRMTVGLRYVLNKKSSVTNIRNVSARRSEGDP